MSIADQENKPSPSPLLKVEPFVADELVSIWEADLTRDWSIYERERKLKNSWEGF